MNDIIYVCPFCQTKFNPMRLGQIFCCREHGWTYRNRAKLSSDRDFFTETKALLANLKALNKFCQGTAIIVDLDELKKAGFQEKYVSKIKCPLQNCGEPGEDDQFFEVCGYVVHVVVGVCAVVYPVGWRFPPFKK